MRFSKDPDDVLDYGFDYTSLLTDTSQGIDDNITSSAWEITPVTSPALAKSNESNGTKKTKLFLSAGALGSEYTVTNSIVTDGGRTFERSFSVQIIER